MKINRGIAVALTAAILASGGGTATALMTAQPAEAASTQPEINAAVQQILNETNAERAKAGLAPLALAPSMNLVAQNWSQAMATAGSMTHNPRYADQLPAGWRAVGENVGQGYTTNTIVAAWMASPGHRANILSPSFTHLGVGYWIDDSGRAWFTQNFGMYDIPQLTEINEPTNTIGKYNFTSTWVAKPAENITSYNVELFDANGILLRTIVTANPTVTFNGLADMTNYTVQVTGTASDATGLTYTSPVKTYTVTTLEDLPTISETRNFVLNAGENQIEASWNSPWDVNGSPLPYKVELFDGATLVETVETSDLSYVFLNLDANTAYTANITASAAIRDKVATSVVTGTATTLLSSVAEVSEPNNVSVLSDTPTTLKATWDAPTLQVGNDLKYLVTLSTQGQPDVVVESVTPSYDFVGLKHNTPYTVTVQANITAENGINERTTTGVTTNVTTQLDVNAVAVTAPTLLPVEVNPRHAVLSWTAPATLDGDLLGYTVTVKQEGQDDRVLETTNNFYVVTDLLENTAYTFEVKANAASVNGANLASATSTAVTHTTPYAPDTVIVSAPTDVAVTAPAYNEVAVTWNAPTNVVGSVTGYKVTLSDGNNVVSTQTVQTLSASFTGLTDYTDYTVEVVALATSADESNNAASESASASVKTPAHVAAPNAPTGLEADNVTHDKATLSWDAPTGVYGTVKDYTVTVQQSGQPDRVFTATDTNYEVTGLTELSDYTVQVTANVVAKDGVKTATSPLTSVELTTTISPSTVKVTAPTALAVSDVTYNSIKASWDAPTDTIGEVTGYEVTVMDGNTVVSKNIVSAQEAVLTGLWASKNYTVEVAAIATSPDKTNTMTSPVATTTVLTEAHVEANNAPSDFKVVAATDTIAVLSWTAPTGVYGVVKDYTVTLKKDGEADRTFTTAELTYEFTGLAEHSSYTAEVVANVVSSNGELTATSPKANVDVDTTWAADAVMVDVVTDGSVLSGTYNSVKIAWVAPADVVGTLTRYTVLVKEDGINKSSYATTSTDLNVENLDSNTEYTFEIRAEAVSANGLNTATSEVTTITAATAKSPVVTVEAPVATISDINEDSATVTWTTPAVTGTISGYKVSVTDSNGVVQVLDLGADINTATLTGLTEGAVYSVSVEASAVAEDGINTAETASTGTSFTTLAAVTPPVVTPPVVTPPVVTPPVVTPPVVTPPVVTPPVVTPPVVTPPVVTPPVVTPEPTVEPTAPYTPLDGANDGSQDKAEAPLADTGMDSTTTAVGLTGILALLAGLGFIFTGRNREGRQH